MQLTFAHVRGESCRREGELAAIAEGQVVITRNCVSHRSSIGFLVDGVFSQVQRHVAVVDEKSITEWAHVLVADAL
jgi:hypothetical protein